MFRDLMRVEIELFSSCNRSCAWCPNNYIVRECGTMQDKTFSSILQSLKIGNFEYKSSRYEKKVITLNGYSEPMMNIDLLKSRVSEIRDVLPAVEPCINTNGDFLTAENLKGLFLEKVSIMDYDRKSKDYWVKKLESCGCKIIEIEDSKISAIHNNISYLSVELSWIDSIELETRGGVLLKHEESRELFEKTPVRSEPCYEALYYPVINYNGSVMPCCHMRSDTHSDMVIGNVNSSTLEDLWLSDRWVDLREIFLSKDLSTYPEYCKTCIKSRSINTDVSAHLKNRYRHETSTNEIANCNLSRLRSVESNIINRRRNEE